MYILTSQILNLFCAFIPHSVIKRKHDSEHKNLESSYLVSEKVPCLSNIQNESSSRPRNLLNSTDTANISAFFNLIEPFNFKSTMNSSNCKNLLRGWEVKQRFGLENTFEGTNCGNKECKDNIFNHQTPVDHTNLENIKLKIDDCMYLSKARRHISIFFNANWLYAYISLKLYNFLHDISQFSIESACNIYGDSFKMMINNRNYIKLNFSSSFISFNEAINYYTDYFEFLAKFFSSIPNLIEDLNLYFKLALNVNIVTEEELKNLIKNKILEILKDVKLMHLKVYLPEFYGLENMEEILLFKNLESAIVAYLIIFCMVNPFETQTNPVVSREYYYISSIFSAKKFINIIAGFGCWLHLFNLLLEGSNVYFQNYKCILVELIYFNELPHELRPKFNKSKYFHFFFKKNFFFYFEHKIPVIEMKENIYSDEVEIFKNLFQFFFFEIQEGVLLEKFKDGFSKLVKRYEYISEPVSLYSLNLQKINSIDIANLWMFVLFTLKNTHIFNFGKFYCSLRWKSKLKMTE